MNNDKLIFWPDSGYYLSFGILLSLGVYGMLYHQLGREAPLSIPVFLITVVIFYTFRQRIVVDTEYVVGPSAYGNIRRTKIPKAEAEAFYTERGLGMGYLIIRHQFSNKQIFAPISIYSPKTFKTIQGAFPPKEKGNTNE